jgi:hypothetical protein
MSYIEISIEDLRAIITGKVIYRKCPCCDNSGTEFWDETGSSVMPYPHPDWGKNYNSGPCLTCDGLGYVQVVED